MNPIFKSPLLLTLLLTVFFGCKNLPVVESKRTAKTFDGPPVSTTHPSLFPDDDTEDANVSTSEGSKGTTSSSTSPSPSTPSTTTTSPTSGGRPSTIPSDPRIGVIVGSGFLRSYIAVGILQELYRARIPIYGLVGFEWGSLPAALYSLNAQANEVEWQMLKMSESSVLKKTLIRNQVESQSIAELQDYLRSTFNHHTFEQSKISFECLSFDYKKKQFFWMKKGEIATALSYCLASPPFFKPYLNNVGAVDLKLAADTLRQKGANYIVFIDTLSSNNDLYDSTFSPEAQVLWSLQQWQIMKTKNLVDFVIDTNTASYSLINFDSRRDMIRKGQEIGQQAVKKLSEKLKL